jgi:hypothetical protein
MLNEAKMSVQPNARVDEMLNNLFASVQRAGPVFTGQAQLLPEGEGYRVVVPLVPHAFNDNDLGSRVQKSLANYIRAFVRESGWRSKGGSFKRGYFTLDVAASRAASSSSQKRNAIL